VTVNQLLAHARSACGLKIRYRLGGGNTNPQAPSPAGEDGSCDCSAFVCWALRIRKYQPDFSWLRNLNGGWMNTDGMWVDARNEPTGFFQKIQKPELGVIVVYPAQWVSKLQGPKVGHVGIVSEVVDGTATRAIHCSAGNFKVGGDAIAENSASIFLKQDATIFARCVTVE